MMSSSSDELLRNGVEPAIDVEHLRVVRGKRVALDDISVQIARGTITGLLGPSGCGKTTLMRSIVGTQIVADGHRDRAGPPGGFRRAAAPGRLRHAGPDHLRRPASHRQRALLRRAVRHRRQRRRRSDRRRRPRRPPNRVVRQPFRRPAHAGVAGLRAGVASRPAGARRAHRRPRPRAAGRPVGAVPPTRHGAARRCWSPATSWTRPTTAATCCSCATATCSPTPPRPKLREDTGCQSLEEAFLSVIRHSTAAAAG